MSFFSFNGKKDFCSKVKVHRTTEGTIFETVCAVLMLTDWGLTFMVHAKPMIGMAAAGTLVVTLLLAVAYKPSFINTSQPITNLAQVILLVRSTRIEAVLASLFFLVYPLGEGEDQDASACSTIATIVFVTGTIALDLYFTLRIKKLKRD